MELEQTDAAPETAGPDEGTPRNVEWDEARKRVETKRNFVSHLVSFVVVNTFLSGSGWRPVLTTSGRPG